MPADVTTLVDPRTGRPAGESPVAGPADVDAAVGAAVDAGRGWRVRTPGDRAGLLLRLAAAVERRAAELVAVESGSTGLPADLVAARDLVAVLDTLRSCAGAGRLLEGRAAGEYADGRTSFVRREPVGVCAVLLPAAHPTVAAVAAAAPALAAGATAVLKPATGTPAGARWLAQLAAEVLPPGVLTVVTGDHGTGRALAGHPEVRLVTVTGDLTAAADVGAHAARHGAAVRTSLGAGRAPVLVLADADLPAVVAAVADSVLADAGQDRAAAARLLVAPPVHDQLLDALVDRFTAAAGTLPPLPTAAARDAVLHGVSALPTGATVHCGGKASGPGAAGYVEPTVISGSRIGDDLGGQRPLGPVVTVESVDGGTEEFLERAATLPHAAAASVWTRDPAVAQQAARRLGTGTVWTNLHRPLTTDTADVDPSRAVVGHTRLKHVMSALDV